MSSPNLVYDANVHPAMAERIARHTGANKASLAGAMGISKQVFHKWVQVHPEFAAAVDRGMQVYGAPAKASLLKLLTGYTAVKKKYETQRDPEDPTKRIKVLVEEVVTDQAPNASLVWNFLTTVFPEEFGAQAEKKETPEEMMRRILSDIGSSKPEPGAGAASPSALAPGEGNKSKLTVQ